MLTFPIPLSNKSSTCFEYVVDRAWNMPTLRGCNRWVVCGGRIIIIILWRSAQSINSILTWLEWPSTRRRRLVWLLFGFVASWKVVCSHRRPRALFDHPLAVEAKWTPASFFTSCTHVSRRSLLTPLYTKTGGIHFPMADTQARQVMNSRFPSPFLFMTQPDLYCNRVERPVL